MDGGAWWATVHGVVQSRTGLSDFTFTFHFHALEKEMATHSSVLPWRIPETGEPGGLPSIGSHRVGHDWSDLAAAAAAAMLRVKGKSSKAEETTSAEAVAKNKQKAKVHKTKRTSVWLHEEQCGKRCGPTARKGPVLWRRKWQPTPEFLPGESHGQRSLAGYSPWGRKESDTTEWLTVAVVSCSDLDVIRL